MFKQLRNLSGGERARLALAILALDGVNLLLLDEPTNHLDIPAGEAMQELLENYRGAILMVSHDRYLIDRLTTSCEVRGQIWEIAAGKLHVFRGSYREYVLRYAATPITADGAAGYSGYIRGSKQHTTPVKHIVLPPKPMFRDNSKETRRRKEELAKVEERIRAQEALLQELWRELQKASEKQAPVYFTGPVYLTGNDQLHELSWQASKTQAALDEADEYIRLMMQWEQLVG